MTETETLESGAMEHDEQMSKLLDDCRRLADLKENYEFHSQKATAIGKKKKELSLALAKEFIRIGLQNTKAGSNTFSLRTDLFVSKKKDASQEEICDALEDDQAWAVFSARAFKSGDLKAYVRELLDEATPGTDPIHVIPEGIRHLFQASRVPTVTCLKS